MNVFSMIASNDSDSFYTLTSDSGIELGRIDELIDKIDVLVTISGYIYSIVFIFFAVFIILVISKIIKNTLINDIY